ncbi:uncharacterized protein METZ01_LOCUS127027 [marine metagenome]|uniref:Uncharacterized protein n=1 Tax=marine metagenome TaxID=408172 RepID=A0A381YCA7_9ZZZZ
MQQRPRGNSSNFNDRPAYHRNGTTNDDRDRDYNGSFCHHDTANDNDIYGHTIKQHGSKGAREH